MGVAFLAVSCIQLQSLQFRSHHCVLLAHSSTKIPVRNYCVKTHWKGSLSAACLLGVPLECFCGPQFLLYLHSNGLSNARVCTAWVEGVLLVSNMYIAWTSRLSECIIPQCVLVDTSLASRSCCALVSELPFVNSDQNCHVTATSSFGTLHKKDCTKNVLRTLPMLNCIWLFSWDQAMTNVATILLQVIGFIEKWSAWNGSFKELCPF